MRLSSIGRSQTGFRIAYIGRNPLPLGLRFSYKSADELIRKLTRRTKLGRHFACEHPYLVDCAKMCVTKRTTRLDTINKDANARNSSRDDARRRPPKVNPHANASRRDHSGNFQSPEREGIVARVPSIVLGPLTEFSQFVLKNFFRGSPLRPHCNWKRR